MPRLNYGLDWELCYRNWFSERSTYISLPSVRSSVDNLINTRGHDPASQIALLLQAVPCLDLTSLSGDDTFSSVHRLCHKAVNPINKEILSSLGFGQKKISCGAVCVYPEKVATCVEILNGMKSNLPVAGVAGCFPSGQCTLEARVREIQDCVKAGAKEVDVVINRDLVLCGKWKELFEELEICRSAMYNHSKMKTIMAVGELGSLTNVYKTSIICMAAGSDFIKTSTGKETVNANLLAGKVMARAIRHYFKETHYRVGLKPAGGIRTAKDVLLWQELILQELGEWWLCSDLFRIGASSLLADIEETITRAVTGQAGKICLPYL